MVSYNLFHSTNHFCPLIRLWSWEASAAPGPILSKMIEIKTSRKLKLSKIKRYIQWRFETFIKKGCKGYALKKRQKQHIHGWTHCVNYTPKKWRLHKLRNVAMEESQLSNIWPLSSHVWAQPTLNDPVGDVLSCSPLFIKGIQSW